MGRSRDDVGLCRKVLARPTCICGWLTKGCPVRPVTVGGGPTYSVRSTTVASAAFFCTDAMPFLALAFDS
ncbi:MAG: hypothetical protein QOJ24_4025 [Mycobacterium sp.]|nr:hypothetical protein [Mycobacterium sp.]